MCVQIYVLSDNRVRRITTSYTNVSVNQGVSSYNRVVTVAGALSPGRVDGTGTIARFEQPKGIMMSPNGRIYVADTLQCRIRRVTPAPTVARPITCLTRLVDVIHPSGCTMYDPPTDVFDRLQTPVEDHLYFMENQTNAYTIQRCMGNPPPAIGPTSSGVVSSSSFGSGTVTSAG